MFVDEARNLTRRFADGRVMHLVEPWFERELATHSQGVYKIPQQPRGEVFVRPEFREAVESRGLRGFAFDPVRGSGP